MKHTIVTTLLTLGVVGGLTAGILETRHGGFQRPRLFKERVADICVEAALRAVEQENRTP